MRRTVEAKSQQVQDLATSNLWNQEWQLPCIVVVNVRTHDATSRNCVDSKGVEYERESGGVHRPLCQHD